MNKHLPHTLKHTLKRLRYTYRRMQTARRWGSEQLNAMPAVLGNAMPKSGSHLIIQILEGLVDLGPFVNPGYPPVHRTESNTRQEDNVTLAEVRRMQPGEIRYGYLHGTEPWTSAATGPGRAVIFVHRDPRDWVISQVFYATDMHPGHMMHAYYNSLPTLEARINAAIEGVDTPAFRSHSVAERFSSYIGWLQVPGALSVRFEDLILNREETIDTILDYLATFGFKSSRPRAEAVSLMAAKVAPRKSGTFRKGQPGEWREHFTADNLARFDAVAGDLLLKLGCEPHA